MDECLSFVNMKPEYIALMDPCESIESRLLSIDELKQLSDWCESFELEWDGVQPSMLKVLSLESKVKILYTEKNADLAMQFKLVWC